MADISYKTYLMRAAGTSTSYNKLIDIRDYPDIGGAPNMLETTTLSDPMKTWIPGLQENKSMEFNCNYTKSDFDAIKALEGTEQRLALWFGATTTNGVTTPDGSDGKATFPGMISVYKKGAGTDAVRQMGVVVAPTGPIVES